MIIKEYIKEGMKLTHPTGIVVIETIDLQNKEKDRLQKQIERTTEDLQRVIQDILSTTNALK